MQTIKASPFIDAFRDRILNWEYKLKMINEVLDEWMRAQKYWLYLEPIFALKEISQRLKRYPTPSHPPHSSIPTLPTPVSLGLTLTIPSLLGDCFPRSRWTSQRNSLAWAIGTEESPPPPQQTSQGPVSH